MGLLLLLLLLLLLGCRDPRVCPGCLGYAMGDEPDLSNISYAITSLDKGRTTAHGLCFTVFVKAVLLTMVSCFAAAPPLPLFDYSSHVSVHLNATLVLLAVSYNPEVCRP
jgi:hypothetical protein